MAGGGGRSEGGHPPPKQSGDCGRVIAFGPAQNTGPKVPKIGQNDNLAFFWQKYVKNIKNYVKKIVERSTGRKTLTRVQVPPGGPAGGPS